MAVMKVRENGSWVEIIGGGMTTDQVAALDNLDARLDTAEPILTRVRTRVFDVKDYGATGLIGQDATAAVQAAIDAAKASGGGIVYFPRGVYTVTSLTVDAPGVTFRGVGRYASTLRSVTGDIVVLDGADGFACEHMQLHGAGGHIFNVASSIAYARWSDLACVQFLDDYSVLDVTDEGVTQRDYIDCLWEHVEVTHTLTATISTFNLKAGAINRNRWVDIRATYSGNYVWWIETTYASSYANDNTIEGVNFEVTNGGGVRLKGTVGTRLNDLAFYDLGATTQTLVHASPAGTLYPSMTTIQNMRRHGGTLGSGLYDVYFGGPTGDNILINCGGATPLTVRTDGGDVTELGGNVTYDTMAGVNRPGSHWARPALFAHPVVIARYTTGARPSAVDSGDGAMIYDTTLDKPIWSNGTVWKDAAGTTV